MNHKKIFSFIAAMAVCFNSMQGAFALTNPSEWASESIEKAQQMGIVPDILDDMQAKNPISRAEFCYVVAEIYKQSTGNAINTNVQNPFTDTNDGIIAGASAVGLVNGRGDGIFAPYDTITRQEYCVMLGNLARVIHTEIVGYDANLIYQFPDVANVSSWAFSDVSLMTETGIITGMLQDDGTNLLAPLETASREQAVVMAMRFWDCFCISKGDEFIPDDEITENEQDPEGSNQDNGQNTINPPQNDSMDSENSTENPNDTVDGDNQTDEMYIVPYDPILPEEAALLTEDERLVRLFGKAQIGFESQEQAEAHMTDITVPVWRLSSDGTKTAGEVTLNVNRNLALVYTAIFEEIFNGDEQFPIKDAGSYAWRTNTRSEHRWGTAIDLNWNENMECNIDENGNVTEITTGSHWLPEQDPFSIPAGGDVVKAFAKYGFAWGGDAWTSKRDYMHFSYFGT